MGFVWPNKVKSAKVVLKSHWEIVLSEPAEKNQELKPENYTLFTESTWPLKLYLDF